ncbi:MAG TPA: hypothetical protein VFJ61_10795 [Solirubrobacterales bacterium]|nr:hypothetical protein [Solirubrobacterales bacterium]
MPHLKAYGLAVLSLVLLAFAGTASATTLTSPAGTAYTGTIKGTSSKITLTNSSTFGTFQCEHSEIEGTPSSHGSGVTAVAIVGKWTFSKCTGGKPTSPVAKPGSWEFHLTTAPNATWTSNGSEWVWHETLVGTCIFITKNTDLGTLKGGTPAKIEIGASPLPQESGNFFCPSSATLGGSYTITSPSTLLVS